ncbi:thioredoxin O2, mitochondrial-like [Aristolochia californica]|uniref:thioredoxin O2, mitochondrial-like n=1 Tax=Aristolochia californica TaxID=171875 RepID=UPI0035D8DB7B
MGRIALIRSLIVPVSSRIASLSSLETLIPKHCSPSPLIDHSPCLFPSVSRQYGRPFFFVRQPFSSSSSGPSGINIIKSEEEFNDSLKNAKDGSLPAIYYFTAQWCGPCRTIAPTIEDLSKKYPHVNIYKIDVDTEGLAKVLSYLQISSVPTFHFFHGGTKARELIGADITKLKVIMETLYKQE